MEKHQDLVLEIKDLKRIHRATRVTVIPTVIGVLGTTSKNTKAWYERLSVPDAFGSGQLSANLAESVMSLWYCC